MPHGDDAGADGGGEGDGAVRFYCIICCELGGKGGVRGVI